MTSILTLALTLPSSDPDTEVTDTFTMRLTNTATGHGGDDANSLHFEFSDDDSTWNDMTASGGLTVTTTNPVTWDSTVLTNDITVTNGVPGTWYVRGSSTGVTALQTTSQIITVNVGGTISLTTEDATSSVSGELEAEGSLAETLEDDTSSVSGELEAEGSLAETLDDATLVASGSQAALGKVWINDAATWDAGAVEQAYPGSANWSDTQIDMQVVPDTTGLTAPLWLIVETAEGEFTSRSIEVQDNDVDGTLAETLANAVSAATGELEFESSLAETLEDAVATAAGELEVEGTLSETLGDATSATAGELEAEGTLSEILEDVTSTTAGELEAEGTLTEVLEDATSSATGEMFFEASLAETLADATSAITGELEVEGSLAETLDDATSVASGATGFEGSLAETLDDATSTASGELEVEGTLAETLDDVTSAAEGLRGGLGTLAETLDDVTPTIAGELEAEGSLSEILVDATSAGAGELEVEGTLTNSRTITNFVNSSENMGTGTKFGVTVDYNVAVAPDGTTTAERLNVLNQNNYHVATQTIDAAHGDFQENQINTWSCYYKEDGERYGLLSLSGGSSTKWFAAIFDLVDGTVTKTQARTATVLGASIEDAKLTFPDAPDGWWRCSVTGFFPTAPTGRIAYLYSAGSATPNITQFGGPVYNPGVDGRDIFMWGAQLEISDTLGPYVKTTSGAASTLVWGDDDTSATAGEIEAEGTLSEILEDVTPTTAGELEIEGALTNSRTITNYATNTEVVPNGFLWQISRDNNVAIAPDGSLTADRLNVDTTTNNHWGTTGNSLGTNYIPGEVITSSLHFKTDGETHGWFSFRTVHNTSYAVAIFDIITGAVTYSKVLAGGNLNTSIEDVGDGWWRCSLTASLDVAGDLTCFAGLAGGISTGDFTQGGPAFTGVEGEDLFAWGTQLELSDTLGPYVNTVSGGDSVIVYGDDDTSAISGALKIEGSLDETLDGDTSTLTAEQIASGVISESLEDDTSTSSGDIYYLGSVAQSLADVTSVASGEIYYLGSLAQSLADATAAASGELQVEGSVAETLDDITIIGIAQAGDDLDGTLAEILDDVTSASAGELKIEGIVSNVLLDSPLAATGEVQVAGTISLTLASATVASTSELNILGTVSRILQDAVSVGTGVAGDFISSPNVKVTLNIDLNNASVTYNEDGTFVVRTTLNNSESTYSQKEGYEVNTLINNSESSVQVGSGNIAKVL
jgi:hypothetical protein